ncbi:NAD(P)/FAD-dependent oxidoreductase [Clostridium sp. D2Q-11]|uniref:NAD(P)/FAD-dependent oxidoreductase n=1 Tax=Anaeromonas frigoriresistens TaxID=2683708 RepID=A0A942UVQ6_9FIRM|nr:NAD(P)/FAD-dependent oxidoreductase [Anaeromonas frigoriresistens]MBS4539943.1 NAD(P)/FAD-dependent oxidoreductase [Anaeromonas frigoriresistens]
MKEKIVVIGGGPAGIIASATASKKGANVILIEKNERIGKKMLITGNGRCNITNLCSIEELIDNVTRNNYFLYSAFYSFTNKDIIDILDQYGLKVKVEDNNRCFPITNKSIDVTNVLERYLLDNNVDISLNTKVYKINKKDDKFIIDYIKNDKNHTIKADKLIISTGGKSYPATGSTGDGYDFAKKLGHNIVSLIPSMVPFNIKEDWIKEIKGISLTEVKISLIHNKKEVDNEIGDIIFTHYGISGPSVFNLSCRKNRTIEQNNNIKLRLDFFPHLNEKEFDDKLLGLLQYNSNKNIINIIDNLIPYALGLNILKRLNIEYNLKANQLNKENRKGIVSILKELELSISGLRSIKEAYVTSGGVDTREINPSTMESDIVKGLYFCGEILDVDAYTGGFNLQIAYSTGYLAGESCC